MSYVTIFDYVYPFKKCFQIKKQGFDLKNVLDFF